MNLRLPRCFHARRFVCLLAPLLPVMLCHAALAQSTAFTYQGQLRQSSLLVNLNSDFTFALYSAASGGAPVNGPITVLNVPVSNGLFTASVDFGIASVGTADRWMEIAVRLTSVGGAYTTLTTRQKVTPAPSALFSMAPWVTSGNNLSFSSGKVGVGGLPAALHRLQVIGSTTAASTTADYLLGLSATDGQIANLYHRSNGTQSYIGLESFNPGGSVKTPIVFQEFGGNVGIGISIPTQRLSVAGTVQSTSGGFRFPDGTTQTTASGTGLWSASGSDISNNNPGNVGIGTTTPGAKLGIYTEVTDQSALEGQGYGTNGTGVLGEGVAIGVEGKVLGTNGTQIAVHGFADRPGIIGTSGRGVVGESDNNTGVEGDSTSGRGVYGTSISWDGVGGLSTSASGVYGRSTSGIGVFGECTTGPGVYGLSTGGYGVSGLSTNNHGVFGSSANNIGVVGTSVANDGVSGFTHGNGQGGIVGIAASDSVNSYGGYFHNDAGGTALYADGKAVVKVLQILGADLTESFNVAGANPEPGDVVVIDAEHPGELKLCASAYDHKVAGIISGAGGIRTAVVMGQPGSIADGKHAVALTGRVYCRCDATQHAIQVGDLLTTSSTTGHAMKAIDRTKSSGTVIGKAMTALKQGECGLVLVLVSLQ